MRLITRLRAGLSKFLYLSSLLQFSNIQDTILARKYGKFIERKNCNVKTNRSVCRQKVDQFVVKVCSRREENGRYKRTINCCLLVSELPTLVSRYVRSYVNSRFSDADSLFKRHAFYETSHEPISLSASHRGNIAVVIKRLSFGVRVDNRLPRRRTADSTKL